VSIDRSTSDAVVIRSYEDGPALEALTVDEPRAGEVLVAVAASGVCGSDIHAVHGQSNAAVLPMVAGHEGSGVVEAVGPGVESVAPGDRVVLGAYGPCYECDACRHGRFVHCTGEARVNAIRGLMPDGTTRLRSERGAVHPYVGIGSLAEYAVLRDAQVVKIPDDVPLDVMALAGCAVTTGLGAVFNIAHVAPGDRVLVIGCGGVGLNVIQGARLAGAAAVIAADTNPARLDLATEFGATELVDPNETPVADAVAKVARGGVDVAFEVVGDPALVVEAFELTRGGGTCVMVGAPPPGSAISVPASSLMFGERRLVGCLGGSNMPHRDIPRIVELYRGGRIKLDELVGERVPLHDFGRAFADTEAGKVARCLVTLAG
jgi:S-(hydroxymethyl)glutathione dehydrogenase/alcohol dehydrogenase